jgi:YD repeat-containing protein
LHQTLSPISDATLETVKYDQAGRVKSVAVDGQIWRLNYDTENNLIGMTSGNDNLLLYAHSQGGKSKLLIVDSSGSLVNMPGIAPEMFPKEMLASLRKITQFEFDAAQVQSNLNDPAKPSALTDLLKSTKGRFCIDLAAADCSFIRDNDNLDCESTFNDQTAFNVLGGIALGLTGTSVLGAAWTGAAQYASNRQLNMCKRVAQTKYQHCMVAC